MKKLFNSRYIYQYTVVPPNTDSFVLILFVRQFRYYLILSMSSDLYFSKCFIITHLYYCSRRLVTSVTQPLLLPYAYQTFRPYAVYSVNNTDKKSFNLHAIMNNPLSPHLQIHRQQCNQLGCDGVIYNRLCSSFKDRKAVAYGTHSNLLKEPRKMIYQITNYETEQKNNDV
jgi:hypothetical protein